MSDKASSTIPLSPPEGWTRLVFPEGFVETNGPLFWRMEEGHFALGLRVEQRHCNMNGGCHGGMISMFADMIMPLTAHRDPRIGRRFTPTIHLSVDFLDRASCGSWLKGRAEILRATNNLAFAQALIYSDDRLAARANGVFKLGKVFTDNFYRDAEEG